MPTSIFTLSLSLIVLALSLSACQQSNTETVNSDTDNWSCQTQDTPFAYSVCRVDTSVLASARYSLQLFWQSANDSQPLLTFDTLLSTLPKTETLNFAMNAGMYDQDYAPIGYTVIAGEAVKSLNLKEGGGNFHLLPNGVMWWDKAGHVQITESHTLDEQINNGDIQPWYATQSGPMLVINDEIHPQFNPESTSIKLRNGAGVCTDGSIKFVNTDVPVTFYQFATLFKEELGCSNALFLDGGIASALYAPSIDKQDKKEMGVMIGLVENKN